MLVVTGTNDPGRKGEDYGWRLHPFTYAAPGDTYLLVIEGADHSFGGLTDTDEGRPRIGVREYPRLPAHVDYVQSATTAFWDAHLRGVEEAERFLQTGTMDRLTDGQAKVTAR